MTKKVSGPGLFFRCCTLSKQRSRALFWPMDTIQENGSSLLCDVISGFIRQRNKHKSWEIAKSIHFLLLLTHCGRWRVFCAKLWHFWSNFCCYIQKQYTNQVFCKKREPSLPVWACFARKWNTEMTSQSELDPFSCIAVHGPEKVQYAKEKSRVKNVLAIVIRAVAKVFLWKKFLGLMAL